MGRWSAVGKRRAPLCGMPHASTRECIEALEREKNSLREHLRHGQPNDSTASPTASDRHNAKAVSPRLAPVP